MASPAAATESISDSFGLSGTLGGQFNTPRGVAVNSTGNGGVPAGTTYVVDGLQNRIQRFDPAHHFVSTWGFDVIKAGEPGDLGENVFEICTTAGECQAGIASTSPAPGGELSQPQGVAVDQATGNVYVTNSSFLRVDEFSATGEFIRAFGKNVVQSGHLGDTGTEFEVCSVAADCQSGESGSGAGAFLSLAASYLAIAPATAPNAGDVLVVDRGNRRVSEYTAAGAFVRSFGWDVVESGLDNTAGGEFEVCKAVVDVCQIGASGSGNGQFSAPIRIAEDSLGTVYVADGPPNFRVEKLTLPGNVVTPEGVFADPLLHATVEFESPNNLAVDGSNNLLVTRGYPAGATPYCLNSNSPSLIRDRRLLTISPAAALLSTSLACIGNQLPSGLAVELGTGTTYLTSSSGPARVYVLGDVVPPTAILDPITEFDAFSATLTGKVDPQGPPQTECRFDYIAKTAFEANVGEGKNGFIGAVSVPCESSPGAGTGPIDVSAQIKGALAPNTSYEVRLVALKTPFGDVATASATEEFTTTGEPPPTIITGAAAPRGTVTARLNGLVNPNNSPTEVHFEYGTAGPCSANPCVSTVSQDVGSTYVPPGLPFVSVSANLEGLQAATTYYYRLVGANGIGSSAGADRSFETRPAEPAGPCPNEDVRQKQHSDSYLPDCRGIELVNAPDKGNQNVFAQIGQPPNPIMTPDGEAALWWVTSGAPGGTASAGSTFLAERTETGWQSRNLVPPPAQQFGGASLSYGVEKATPDLGAFVFNAGSNALDEGRTLLRLDRSQHQEVLASYENRVNAEFGEISDDGAHVLIVNPDTGQLEDVGDPGEAPETISLMPPPASPLGVPQPGGTPSACGLATTGESFAGHSASGEAAGNDWNPGYRMIAAKDASRAYFEVQADGDCAGPYGLYERNLETQETTPIDPGTPGVGAIPNKNVEFIRATPDGRSAYFATSSRLDPADQNTGSDVYRWDEDTGQSSCLTCSVLGANVAPATTGQHLTQVMVSDDFSHVYFQSNAQLVPGYGEAGSPNTYALSGGAIHFVAGKGAGNLGISGQDPHALVSSDGDVLVFVGTASGGAQGLTADQVAAECTVPGSEPGPCQELYRYDDRDGSLECISCRQDGKTTESAFPQAQFRMSPDGDTVVFVTFESLVAHDVNQGLDIYEWRDGAVHLISDGVRSFPVGLAAPQVRGVDAGGRNVLFSLVAPNLTGFEQDGLRNLYDARIEGGFLPPSSPAHCAEDSCQGPLQSAPLLAGVASSNESRGNVVGQSRPRHPCAKKRGKARRRCVRKHRRRSRQAGAAQVRGAR